ncbi:unnamed protein product [Blepharisma stoltei]|uniref:Uncharacterized protein n=1 Tax=Blepharisma stoltei TaxID=1481888 RepID=A0AAU9IJK0_9CILI|nr:unnamed protein product [Blepharisma stoltei]
MLSISEEILSLIISEEFSKPSPKPTTNHIKPNHVKKPKQIPTNNISNPIEIETYEPVTAEESKNVLEELKRRITQLYRGNVKIKVIMALFDIRNSCFIHSFGDWERSVARQRLFELREKITQLKSEGKTDEEISKILCMRENKMREIMGDLKRPKLVYTTQDIKEAICLYKTIRNKKRTAKELGVSVFTLEEWINKSKTGELWSIYDNDEGIPSTIILNALETYYLTKNLEAAAKVSGLTILKVSKFVERCRMRSLEFKDKRKNSEENHEEE